MPRLGLTFTALSALLLSTACDDASGSTASIQLRDDCDPATFNAALGAGTCQHSSQGGVTVTAFNSELTANHSVAAWSIRPATLTLNVGTTLPVMNLGGETHTYTEVEQFGGGVVPALNQLSGNTTVAPECADQAGVASSTVVSGGTMQHTFDETGTERYQCCIHPWMRQTVTVR